MEFEDASFTYLTQSDRPALDGISFGIERGEFVGIAGPSDVGKSTVCRLMHSYIPNFFDGDLSGTVTVDGTDVTETSIGELSETVGLLFENPFDQLTGASTTVFEELVDGLVADGTLVVVVTHDMNFVRDTADHVIALRQGEVLLDGSPEHVFGEEERLAETDVHPPTVTRIARRLGIEETILTVDELFEYVE